MPAKVLKGAVDNVVPAQRAIVKGGCGGRERLEMTVEHLSQISGGVPPGFMACIPRRQSHIVPGEGWLAAH